MTKYRRTETRYRNIGRSERSFREDVKETEAIDERYVEDLRRRFEGPKPSPKVRVIRQPKANGRQG